MAAIIWTDVVSLAPELASTGATTQNDILAYVNVALNVAIYDTESGPTIRLARIYYAAHMATLARRGGNGALISSNAGGLERGYAAPIMGSGMSSLLLTSYGQAFRQLIPPVARGPMVL